jgi:hypothetical protein
VDAPEAKWRMCPALDAGFFIVRLLFIRLPDNASAECWSALTGSGQSFFDNRKAGNPRRKSWPDYGQARRHGVDNYKFARVEQNCGQTKAAQTIA